MPSGEGKETWSCSLHIDHQFLSRAASRDAAFTVDTKRTPSGASSFVIERRKVVMWYTCSSTLIATTASNKRPSGTAVMSG